jgi:acyl transferase domain-containing protein/SAM-dependent methyltransferase
VSSAHGSAPASGSPIQRALAELREMRARLDASERSRTEPVAIVGMGCRFPGASGPDAFWTLLRDGVDAITEIPSERWDVDRLYDPDPAAEGRMSTRWGGFVDGIDRFDPAMFGISPREAMAMDPQQRMLLEVAWEALEHAGQAPDRLRGTPTGVFTGISSFDYVHLAMSAPPERLDGHLAQGIAHSAASGRISYVLGLQGPAVSLDTACSSSLVAVHLAVASLRRGECGIALAGGANAILLPTFLIGFSRSQMMAADGRCKAFDARADGFVRGEGAGIVVLKRLSDALADGDHVWATIRGSATNQDGRSSGMTAPNGVAQQAVLRAALADARIAPHRIAYVEAHGTGTALGDPIEAGALGAVMGEGRPADRRLRIGSLKSNVGHLEAAAGVASVIKAALMLHHGEIPPTLHVQKPNPYIDWDALPLELARERGPLPADPADRILGVSSFGFTGTNAHVVLAPAPTAAEPERSDDASIRVPRVVALSAADQGSLERQTARWAEWMRAGSARFADACHTATVARASLAHRVAVVANNAREAATLLEAWRSASPSGITVAGVRRGGAPEVAWLFSGHGAQHPGMARALHAARPSFRRALDACDAAFREHLDGSLLDVLLPDPDLEERAAGWMQGMTWSQPALFAVEYALARMWEAWGVHPAAVLGHSVGEYAAACIAGVLTLEDAATLVAARGRLMDGLEERGGMLAVLAAPDEVERRVAPFADRLSVAALNGPSEAVVSGDVEAVDRFATMLAGDGIEVRRLAVSQAGHSRLLDPMLDEFERLAGAVRFRAPRIDLISCTTGRAVSADEVADPRYWRRHLRETVRFADGLRTLHARGFRVFLEVGPHAALSGLGARAFSEEALAWIPSQHRDRDGDTQAVEALATLWANGVDPDWRAFDADRSDGESGRRVPAPTYAWNHARYWLEHAPASGRAADPQRTWDLAVAAGRRQEAVGPLDLDVGSFARRWDALSRLSTDIIRRTLAGLGAFGDGRAHDPDALVAELGIQPRYALLIDRWLRRLGEAGVLRRLDQGWVAGPAFGEAPTEDAWTDAAPHLAGWEFMEEYLRRCEQLLPEVLTGSQNPLETIFPDGSFHLADALYRDSVMPRYFNGVAHAIVEAFAHSGIAAPRVLEVGGGTGGTTATLLPAVADAGGSYTFTDVSELFLARASERLGVEGTLRLGLLDVDRDPADQGYAAHAFDLVVAANVVHAAADVRRTLGWLRNRLAPGGLLMLVEVTEYLDWFDVSTALLEGWDRQSDDLRGDHPMLDPATWRVALLEAGFEDVAAFPAERSPAAAMGQHLIIARAPASPDGLTSIAHPSRAGHDAPARPAKGAGPNEFSLELGALPPHEREEALVVFVRAQVAALLRLPPDSVIDRHRRLMELGLDSLMAVELRARLGRGLGLVEPLPATLVFDHPSVDAIVSLLSQRFALELDGATEPDPRPDVPSRNGGEAASAPGDATVIDELSDDEVESRLLARLREIEGGAE